MPSRYRVLGFEAPAGSPIRLSRFQRLLATTPGISRLGATFFGSRAEPFPKQLVYRQHVLAQLSIASANGRVVTDGWGERVGAPPYPFWGERGQVAGLLPDPAGLGLILHGEGGLCRVHGLASVGKQALREGGSGI